MVLACWNSRRQKTRKPMITLVRNPSPNCRCSCHLHVTSKMPLTKSKENEEADEEEIFQEKKRSPPSSSSSLPCAPAHTSGPVDGSLYATVQKPGSGSSGGGKQAKVITFQLPYSEEEEEETATDLGDGKRASPPPPLQQIPATTTSSAVHTISIDSGISSTVSMPLPLQQTPSPKMSESPEFDLTSRTGAVNVEAEVYSQSIDKDRGFSQGGICDDRKPLNGSRFARKSEFDEVFDGLLRQIASITEGLPNGTVNTNQRESNSRPVRFSSPPPSSSSTTPATRLQRSSSSSSAATASTVIPRKDLQSMYSNGHMPDKRQARGYPAVTRPALYSCPDEMIDKRALHLTRPESRPFTYGVTAASPQIQRRRQYSESTAYVSESKPSRCTAYTRAISNDDESEVFSDYYQDDSLAGLTWLQRQQQKLRAKREGRVLEDRQLKEQLLIAELSGTVRARRDPLEDLSRESSPVSLSQPIHVAINGHSRGGSFQRQNSAPSSPITPTRVSSKALTLHRYQQPAWPSSYASSYDRHQASSSLQRQRSDNSFDRERPFVAVKKLHQLRRDLLASGGASPENSIISAPAYATMYRQPRSQQQQQQFKDDSSIRSHSNEDDYPVIHQSTPKNTFIDGLTSWSPSLVSNNSSSQASPSIVDRAVSPSFPTTPRSTAYALQDSSLPLSRKAYSPQFAVATVSSNNNATGKDGLVEQDLNGVAADCSSIYYGHSRRSSISSLNENEMIAHHPQFVKDTSKFWYKPKITRDDAILYLKDKPPGTFIIRDSISFPGAFGLVLKVATPPPNIQAKNPADMKNELVRHFLIEPTSKGVQLKGCANEPVFGSLSTLVYQHSVNAMALPCRLILPEPDKLTPDTVDGLLDSLNMENAIDGQSEQEISCNVLYLLTVDTETLTGPEAVKKSITELLLMKPSPTPTVVRFKVSAKGITLTDNNRRLFFRRHYPISSISHCGKDPENRQWSHSSGSSDCFGFIARKAASKTDNQCHIFAALEKQPVNEIFTFVNKILDNNNGNTISR